jgi:hypothetical protein
MAQQVPERPPIVRAVTRPTIEALQKFTVDLVKTLVMALAQHAVRLNHSLQKDGTEAMEGPLTLTTYTTATRPTASDYEGAVIYVSDGSGGSKFQGSDGSSWVSLG